MLRSIILLAALSSLSAWGQNQSAESALKNYDSFQADLSPGMVFKTKTFGERYDIKSKDNETNGTTTYFPMLEKEDVELQVVILKILDGRIYTYETYKDNFVPEHNHSKVRAYKKLFPTLEKMIRYPGATFDANYSYLSGDYNNTHETGREEDFATITSEGKLSIKLDVVTFCHTRAESDEKLTTFKYRAQSISLTPVNSVEEINCGEKLSKEELKKIDLTSVELCDDQDENCSNGVDMTHLLD